MTTYWDNGTGQEVIRNDNVSTVVQGVGYSLPGNIAVELTDTGNGFIAKFPAYPSKSTDQDYYLCMSYSQAYDLILAFSAFKKELGFE